MSDEQDQRRDPVGRDPQPDETRQLGPLADDSTVVGQNRPDGRPRSGDATSIMPPVGGDAGRGSSSNSTPTSWSAAEAPWSGRAEVRPPRPGDYDSADWATEPPAEPRGRWWMPILVGIIGLVVVGLLGWGIWLIARAQSNGGGTPATTPTAATPAPTATHPIATQATAPPTTAQPTSETTPSTVTIPALRGLTQEEGQQALTRRGLSSRLRFVNSTKAPPGTVIDSDPAEGQQVPPDTVVTLVIAAEPTTSPTPSSTSPTTQPGN